MSKIQKAIRQIEKQKSKAPAGKSQTPLGKIIADDTSHVGRAAARLEELGDDTMQMAALDSDKVRKRIVIDREALREAGFFAPEDEERVLVDQYRQIKRPLLAHAFGKRATRIQDGHIVLVTSAMAGDGKTFTAINLALSIAREQDSSVLLVDADVVKGHITRLFGARKEPGLLDVLEQGSTLDLDDTIFSTDVKGLSVMTAGAMRPHSTELLASERMESLIRALSAQDPNRIVLFDSSPLLATSEPKVLASLVGQIVLVVCAEQTPQQAVIEAVADIDESKALNLVLNQARRGGGDYYSSYYKYDEGSVDED